MMTINFGILIFLPMRGGGEIGEDFFLTKVSGYQQ
jgi:hypothetical protein